LGVTGGDALILGGESIAVAALKRAHEDWLPNYMAGGN
jgi:phosphoribosylformylglycinamidine synthase